MAERRSTNAALRALQAQEAAWRAEDEERARRYVDLSKIKVRRGETSENLQRLGVNTLGTKPGDKPRNLNVRVKPQAQISAPRIATPDRALMALERFSPALGSAVREADDFLGLTDLYRSGIRSAADALGGDVYAGNEDLQYDDRQNLLLNAALTVAGAPLAEGAGAVGRRVLNAVPAGVRQGASDLAARGVSWLRENAPLLSRGVSAPLRDVDYVEGVFRDLPEEMGAFAVWPQGQRQIATTYREPGALPAPPRVLGLPAPGPGLPPFAAKPRGGQWWADSPYLDVNVSPEAAAREGAEALGFKTMRWEPEVPGDLRRYLNPKAVETSPEQQWLERALAKYYKTEFGAPTDPLRDLAERGLHYDPEMTPERWQQTVNDYLLEDPLQGIMFPSNPAGGMPGAGDDLRGQVMSTMPWLAKQPVTDNLYGISKGGLDLEHFTDEFYNALNPELSGLPADLAVRPESLGRMTFPQAVERVGRINQWRAKQMEEASLSSLNSPAVQLFKDYPENNPRGLRWVELRAPEPSDDLLDELDRGLVDLAVKEGREIDPAHMDEVRASRARRVLEDALRYEGDTMGHCVGGYCDDVLGGRSRIFSLRDAKGEPHVTIETAPGAQRKALADIPREALDQITAAAKADTDSVTGPMGIEPSDPRWIRTYQTNLSLKQREWLRDNPMPSDIVQIKGKQNRAPNDEYLPFVQDFVKSGQWGNVGDLRNTGLVRLPDGRYITDQQWQEGLTTAIRARQPDVTDDVIASQLRQLPTPGNIGSDWDEISPHFEGYAVGGRVDADRCFCKHPMSVKRKAR